jgi:hypothetical protein
MNENFDRAQLPRKLAFNQSEFNWIAIEGEGKNDRGERRHLAFLFWITRTGPRTKASFGPTIVQGDELPWPLGALVPPWMSVLSPVRVDSDDRPLFMAVLYDLDDPEASPKQVELEIDHADFDHETFSAETSGLKLDQHHLPTRITIDAETRHFAARLQLKPLKPMVVFGETPHGDPAPGVKQGPLALSYAQRPRLAVVGEVLLGGYERIKDFAGEAVQDRQWLTVTATGMKWIWIQLRLPDGSEIVGHAMRDSSAGKNASANEGRLLDSTASLVTSTGERKRLRSFNLSAVSDHDLQTPHGNVPTRFRLEISELDLALTLEHIIKNPFVSLKAFGPTLNGGIWEGPARIVESNTTLKLQAWIEVMNSACVTLA